MTETTRSREVPQHLRGVIPYLTFDGDAGAAAELYMAAFGASDDGRMPNPERPGRYMHIQLRINGGTMMICDYQGEGAQQFGSGHLQLVVEDGKAAWDRAVAAGMSVVMPYERQFWGDHWGLLKDRFGLMWAIMEEGSGEG